MDENHVSLPSGAAVIALWILSAHLIGDFVLQSRAHVLLKRVDWRVRAQHVGWYMLPFVPLAFVYTGWSDALGFLWCVAAAHYITDSHRFRSTLGDLIQWRINLWEDPVACKRIWLERVTERAESAGLRAVDVDDRMVRWPPPNEWPPLPLIIDQTLHVVQLTVLAAVFLT